MNFSTKTRFNLLTPGFIAFEITTSMGEKPKHALESSLLNLEIASQPQFMRQSSSIPLLESKWKEKADQYRNQSYHAWWQRRTIYLDIFKWKSVIDQTLCKMVRASPCGSCGSCVSGLSKLAKNVCKSDNFCFNIWTPFRTIFSGFNAPQLSTVKKNLFGFPSQLYGASSIKSKILQCDVESQALVFNKSKYERWSSSNSEYSLFCHSSGLGNKVCRNALSGSYSKPTLAVGFHLACSFPNPFLA